MATQSTTAALPVPLGLLGLPSLHSIIQAIAGGFFTALAEALVPSWLRHGTVATIQHLVALPDPGTWSHVKALQGEMTYLAVMLLPVTLAVTATRYWLVGLTGAAHPATAVTRTGLVTGVLVGYRWIVEQTVAATNTLTHGLLGLPAVSAGLARIISVLFGGALLAGGGGVFGALLVIIGVVFAAGLFAAQVLLTIALALLCVIGPPLIALSAIPELSHLARGWADSLLAVALVPIGWTILFATAGALSLDATNFGGGSGGLPEHVAAAFAGLITFILAVRLPFIAVGEIRSIIARHSSRTATANTTSSQPAPPGADRVKTAHARLRAIGLQAVPALGASVGGAAGALGAPAGGPIGALKRRAATITQHARPGAAGARTPSHTTPRPPAATPPRRGARQRIRDARTILAAAPAQAAKAMRSARQPAHPVKHTSTASTPSGGAARSRQPRDQGSERPSQTRPPGASERAGARVSERPAQAPAAAGRPTYTRQARTAPRTTGGGARQAESATSPASASRQDAGPNTPGAARAPQPHAREKPAASTRRQDTARSASQQRKPSPRPQPPRGAPAKDRSTAPASKNTGGRGRRLRRHKPRPTAKP